MGIEVSRQASWMPPIAMKTFFDPSASSQRLKNSENTKPWKISARHTSELDHMQYAKGTLFDSLFEKFSVTNASPAYCR